MRFRQNILFFRLQISFYIANIISHSYCFYFDNFILYSAMNYQKGWFYIMQYILFSQRVKTRHEMLYNCVC